MTRGLLRTGNPPKRCISIEIEELSSTMPLKTEDICFAFESSTLPRNLSVM